MELFIGRILFAIRRTTGSRESFNAQFSKERGQIRRLVESCSEGTLPQRVLIARAIGMEDSSRHWSVLMTLDHLRIVNLGMARIIGDLSRGQSPSGTVSTADVKPSTQVTTEVIAEYEKSCDALLAVVAGAGNLKTRVRHLHPWFGPMNAHGWYALAAGHMGIHRVQIERINNGLRGANK